ALIPSRLFGIIVAFLGIVVISNEQTRDNEGQSSSRVIDLLGIGLAAAASLLYAIGTTLAQIGMEDIDPIGGNFILVLSGSIAFVPVFGLAKQRGMPMPTLNATRLVAIAGMIEICLGFLLFLTAVKYAGATISAVTSSAAPLFAVPISVFYLKERVTWRTTIGVIVTVIGIVLVVIGF
ncbi:MAG: EamA family transporter, partial [Candidatus Thorarchaeota archaeon]